MLFFALLTLSYANLPADVSVHTNEAGAVDWYMEKGAFYYAALIIFVVSNLVSFYFIRVLDSVPASTGFYFKNYSFKSKLISWFAGFVTMVNLFLLIAVAYIVLFNLEEYQINKYQYLFYLIPVLFVGSAIWLFSIYTNRHRQLDLDA